MKDGTLQKKGNLFELRYERLLAHRPEKVWRALTDNAELSHWFPARIEGAREAGAELRFVFPGESGPPTTGKVSVFDPPRVLEFSWEGDVLRWELKPEGPGCLLVFTSTFDDRARAHRDGTGWHMCLENLETLLDGKPSVGFDKERMAVLDAQYAARFGLGSFPTFLTTPGNRLDGAALRVPGVEVHMFDGADGNQLTLCHAKSDADTGEHLQDFEEYLVVLEGTYVLSINGTDFTLGAGREFVVPRGARIRGRYTAGTRTLHAFGGRGLKRPASP
ncbi:SRPBCC domain-containing protein [Pyxidicoccus xibeiensis]|uniref:SRPBCC domain-containing protein n=1 Tax=Pyxidicoccus xibeiensis TaxID=2906759 RepID=UPI0020A7D50B|nr:SRPBCC domain-containing protein [Pyxidicoccus xibeiensis]MCP3136914.1 SRPBCC domain-containing protein [Pyxidicoccus xibeiensis]